VCGKILPGEFFFASLQKPVPRSRQNRQMAGVITG
jgi:hypothetical protein